MKTAKKTLAILLAVIMVLALSATAFAAPINSGKNGPATITIKNPEIGSTYNMYKIFDATVSQDGTKIAYKTTATSLVAGGVNAGDTGTNPKNWFHLDAQGNVTKVNLTEADLKSADFETWAIAFGASQWSKTVAESDLTEGKLVVTNLPYGYYMITTTTGDNPVVTVDSTTPNAEINDKNSGPTWKGDGKVIDKGNNVTASVYTAKLDEENSFFISINGKNYDGADKIYKYQITDTMARGMTYNPSGLTVTVGGATPLATPTITWYTDHAMTQTTTDISKASAFKVELPWTNGGTVAGDHLYENGKEIRIAYTAKLDSEKLKNDDSTDNVLFTAANENKANFKWYKGTLTTPTGDPPEKKTETFATELQISKVDGQGNALAGAEFRLSGPTGKMAVTTGTQYVADNNGSYWKLKDGTYTTTAPTATGVNQNAYADTTQKYRMDTYTTAGKSDVGTTVGSMSGVTNAGGKLTFSGLIEGDYTLTETVAPAGYNKADPITFTVSFDAAARTWIITPSNSGVNVSNGALTVPVINNMGQELPSTGGIGTTIFYVLGSALLLGAAVLLITRKRMSREG